MSISNCANYSANLRRVAINFTLFVIFGIPE